MLMVGDDDVAAIRILLNGDWRGFGRLLDEWERPGEDMRFGAFLMSAVGRATRARFGNGWSHADVTRYSGDVRDR